MASIVTQPVHSENISPRTRFQQSGTRISAHRDLITRPEFIEAIDRALLEYQSQLSVKCTDQYSAMRNGLCILGANEFIAVLRKLADKDDVVAVKPASDNLPMNGR